ncbi:MAG: ECF-type sigma factor [Planctomycetota bacterium]
MSETDGTSQPFDALVESAYRELQAIARGVFRAERAGHTLQPTALVHEAVVRLRAARTPWKDQDEFIRAAVSAMRRVLVDHARGRDAAKRGGGMARANITMEGVPGIDLGAHVLELDDALSKLERIDARRARVAMYRLFGGLENRTVAELLEVSPATASEDWSIARAWLAAELAGEK